MAMHLLDLAVRRQDHDMFLVKAEFGFAGNDDTTLTLIQEFDRAGLEGWLAGQAYINADQRADFKRWLLGAPQAVPATTHDIVFAGDHSIN